MQKVEPEQVGKLLIVAGAALAAIGGLVLLLGKLGLFHLPGDLEFGGRNWKVYIPAASCILLSLILTFIFWLIYFFLNNRQ